MSQENNQIGSPHCGHAVNENDILKKILEKIGEVFPEDGIVATLPRQLSWSHFKELVPINEPLQREFYTEMCQVERWNVRTLRDKIGSMLYERTAIPKEPEDVVRAERVHLRSDGQLSPALVFKDPYHLRQPGIR